MDRRFAVGIDLGTSTSEICVYRNGEPFVIPDPHTKSPVIPSLPQLTKLELRWLESVRLSSCGSLVEASAR